MLLSPIAIDSIILWKGEIERLSWGSGWDMMVWDGADL